MYISINYSSIVYHGWLPKPVDYDCYEEKTTQCYTDVFINCSSVPIDAVKVWEFGNSHIYNDNKYTQNNSGLTIHNVTGEDQGYYICYLDHIDLINATILLNIVCK